MAAFLKPVPSTVKARDSHDEEKVKLYYVLALVSPETKAKKHGEPCHLFSFATARRYSTFTKTWTRKRFLLDGLQLQSPCS